MKITIDIAPKELAELFGTIRLHYSNLADAKEQIVDEITRAVSNTITVNLGLANMTEYLNESR